MDMTVLIAIIGGIPAIAVAIISVVMTLQRTRAESERTRRRDKITYLEDILNQMAAHYGDARKYLVLEDAGALTAENAAELARALGTIEAFARSVNDAEIDGYISALWLDRGSSGARGKVEAAAAGIITRLGGLITEYSGKKSS